MSNFKFINDGDVTTPEGFLASGVTAGFKRTGAPDFAVVYSEEKETNFAGVFTSCTFAAAPVRLCQERVKNSKYLRAIAINSGIANACTGAAGLAASEKSCEMLADALHIPVAETAVASTGRIGVQLDMDLIKKGLDLAVPALSAGGGANAARAIMTTDTLPKAIGASFCLDGKECHIGAMVKGAGMIDPHLQAPHATMICVITTDVKIDNASLLKLLAVNADNSFNRITVDGDMSTNDTVICMANGRSGAEVKDNTAEFDEFSQALGDVMRNLARRMVGDGEGATKLVTVEVVNARSNSDAKLAAEAVANSLLCKTAWFGNDPNWGRVVAALGYSGAKFDPDKCDVWFGNLPVVRNGGDAGTAEERLLEVVKQREFTIRCDFHDGNCDYWVWTSDVSYEYVKINADYHT